MKDAIEKEIERLEAEHAKGLQQIVHTERMLESLRRDVAMIEGGILTLKNLLTSSSESELDSGA